MPNDTVDLLNASLEGRYTVGAEIGEGGMATVYLAEDVKHRRKVALKVLKPELAAVVGAERFLAEIEVTANLQHPNILPLFDSGEAGGFLFYVMPFIEGESLRDRLDREGQLPVDEAVQIVRDVCDALQLAHDRGVIHRDIKPANILLSRGKPLIADFGIALAVSAAAGTRLTETGLSVGTPHYMSPERATGDRDATPASDIYALGAVLYEMLAGQPPHTGPSAQAVLAKVLTQQAESLTGLRDMVPEHIAGAVHRALERVPADRFSTVDDFGRALADVGFRHSHGVPSVQGGAVGSGRAGRASTAGWFVAAVMTLVAGVLGWGAWLGPSTADPLQRFVVPLPEDETSERVGSWGPALAISDSGSRLAFVSRRADGVTRLFVKDLDDFDARLLPGTEGAWSPFFSPDEQWIGFFAEDQMRKVSVDGGTLLDITDVSVSGSNIGGATWGPDNTIVFATQYRSGLQRVSAEGGEVEQMVDRLDTPGSARVLIKMWPQFLPGGKAVLYTATSGTGFSAGLAVLDLESSEERFVTNGGGNGRYTDSGHLVYAQGGSLLAQPFDLDGLVTTGPPTTAAEGVMTGGEGTGHFDISVSGALAFMPGRLLGPARRLEWRDVGGGKETLPLPPTGYGTPRVSPDGGRFTYTLDGDIATAWIYDVERDIPRRATEVDFNAGSLMWTPDGRRVVFTGNGNLVWVPADGSGTVEVLLARENTQFPHSWTENGQGLLFSEIVDPVDQGGGKHGEILLLEMAGDRAIRPVLATPAHEMLPEMSPDGRWLAYVIGERGGDEVFVRPYPGPGAVIPISVTGGTGPAWSPDGSELYYRDVSGDTVRAVTFQAGERVRVGPSRVLFTGNYIPDYPFGRNYDVSPFDGRFLMTTGTPPLEGWDRIHVVLGWVDSLRDD